MQEYLRADSAQVSTRYTSHKTRGWAANAASAEFDLVERFTGHPIAVSASHEAAHAVVAMALGVTIETVSIGLPRPCMKAVGPMSLGDYVMATIAAAGLIADRLHDPAETGLYFGPDTDESAIVRSIVHTLYKPTEQIDPELVIGAMFNAVGIAAWQILHANGDGVDALASALLQKVTVTGEEARVFVQSLTPFTHEQLKAIVETEALRLAKAP